MDEEQIEARRLSRRAGPLARAQGDRDARVGIRMTIVSFAYLRRHFQHQYFGNEKPRYLLFDGMFKFAHCLPPMALSSLVRIAGRLDVAVMGKIPNRHRSRLHKEYLGKLPRRLPRR